jgi:hypothetical protein
LGGDVSEVDNLTVPLKCWRLINEGQPLGKGGIRPLGDVRVMDHLAGNAVWAVTLHMLMSNAELQSHMAGLVSLTEGIMSVPE